MAGYTTVSTFFDESGKFKDKDVICFGGIASYAEDLARFSQEWGKLLAVNGIEEFSAKEAFNHRRRLGKRNSALGVRKRIAALRPFIQCIRNNLLVATGVTIDVPAFGQMPSHLFQIYGKNPALMAFLRSLVYVLDFTPPNDKISFICDDEEEMALPFYHLYRRVIKIWPGAKDKLAAISFVDSKSLWGLQAADLIAGLMRLEAERLWFKRSYNYRSLFKQLSVTPSWNSRERIRACDIAFVAKDNLQRVAAGIKDEWLKVIDETKDK
jgi:hypothetical protein